MRDLCVYSARSASMGLTEAARRAGKRLAAKADTLRATTTAASQRAREIGVRMAMGAQRSTVSRMILREAAWLTVIGVLLGLAGALGAARLMGSLLFNVQTIYSHGCRLSTAYSGRQSAHTRKSG